MERKVCKFGILLLCPETKKFNFHFGCVRRIGQRNDALQGLIYRIAVVGLVTLYCGSAAILGFASCMAMFSIWI
jgi:hypothetical protein